MERIAIIVGASGSLGKELIKTYLSHNYNVLAIYNNHHISLNNKELIKLKYDVSKEKEYLLLQQELKSKVNNKTEISVVYAPGIYNKVDIDNYNEEDLFYNIKINAVGFLNIFKIVFKYLKKAKLTNVVLIGSNLLKKKNHGSLYYVLAKGMQVEIVKQFAYEYSKYNILFNQICPGMFISNMNRDTSKEKIKMIENNIPIGRLGKASEIANHIFNFTDSNTLINGETIIMDGGNTIGY